MTFGLSFRAQLEKIPGGHWVVQALNNIITAVTDSYHTQHNTDDTHAAVTATSVFTPTEGAAAGTQGAYTRQTGYASPTAVRWIFGDATGFLAVWSRWASFTAHNQRNPAAANVVDLMTLSDFGVLSPLTISGPSGVIGLGSTTAAAGGGAGATLTTIGGSGPATATQAGWIKVTLNGTTAYLPYWT